MKDEVFPPPEVTTGIRMETFGDSGGISDATLKMKIENESKVSRSPIFHQLAVEIENGKTGSSTNSTLSLKKKKVNIVNNVTPNSGGEAQNPDRVDEGTALQENRSSDSAYTTLSGTISRGKKSGQNVDVKVTVSRDELEKLELTRLKLKGEKIGSGSETSESCGCSFKRGGHVFLWSMLCFPFVLVICSVYSFYLGTITWYNILSVCTEDKPLRRLLAAPFLILCYPFIIVVTTFGVGFYSAFDQLSCSWKVWLNKVHDLEKGFYGWLCARIHLEECSPYTEVVIVNQLQSERSGV